MTESSEHRRAPEFIVPQAIAIDFDRTLGDVDASMQRFYAAAEFCGVDTEQIEKARATTEQDGGSFDPLSFIEQTLPEEAIDTFRNHFITSDGPSILYDDALPFLKKLQTNGLPYHVLTYGVNPRWQQLKVEASGYQGGVTIMNHIDKGKEITGWMNSGNTFDFGNGHARAICLIDDKAEAFKTLPEHCNGFLVQRSDMLLPSQQGSLPSNVEIIRSLNELQVVNGILTSDKRSKMAA